MIYLMPPRCQERRALEIPCSAEPELIRAQADYVRPGPIPHDI